MPAPENDSQAETANNAFENFDTQDFDTQKADTTACWAMSIIIVLTRMTAEYA